MFKKFFLFFLISIYLYSAGVTIRDINIKDKGNKVDLILTFSTPYDGMVTRKSGQAIQKIILNGATLSRKFSRVVEDNPLLSKIDILPFEGKVDILLSTTKDKDISYSQSSDASTIIVTVTESLVSSDKIDSEEISPDGESAVNNTSPRYWLTIFILIAFGSLIFIFKKQVLNLIPKRYQNESNQQEVFADNNEDWNTSNFNNTKKEPVGYPLHANNKSQNSNSNSNSNINRTEPKITPTMQSQAGLNSSLSKIQAPPVKLQVRKNPNSFPSQTENVEVIFDERTSVGRVFSLKIGDIKHYILEGENGMTMIKLWSEHISNNMNIDSDNDSETSIKIDNIDSNLKVEKSENFNQDNYKNMNNHIHNDNKGNDISELFSDSKIKLQ